MFPCPQSEHRMHTKRLIPHGHIFWPPLHSGSLHCALLILCFRHKSCPPPQLGSLHNRLSILCFTHRFCPPPHSGSLQALLAILCFLHSACPPPHSGSLQAFLSILCFAHSACPPPHKGSLHHASALLCRTHLLYTLGGFPIGEEGVRNISLALAPAARSFSFLAGSMGMFKWKSPNSLASL